jgi:cell division protease FtsH
MLAKALVREAKMPFIYCSASELDEPFYGSVSLNVRKIFSDARLFKDGCILFMDEFDSIAIKTRRGGTSEKFEEQTKKQFLAELDGFKENKKILVLAASNREIKDLEKAIVRPGRFDRYIHIGNPDIDDRRELISLFMNKRKSKKIVFDIKENLEEIFFDDMSSAQIICILSDSILSCSRASSNGCPF